MFKMKSLILLMTVLIAGCSSAPTCGEYYTHKGTNTRVKVFYVGSGRYDQIKNLGMTSMTWDKNYEGTDIVVFKTVRTRRDPFVQLVTEEYGLIGHCTTVSQFQSEYTKR